MSTGYDGELSEKDAAFIAHAPKDIAYLLERVEALEVAFEEQIKQRGLVRSGGLLFDPAKGSTAGKSP